MRETTIDHVEGEDYILYYTSEKKWMNQLRRQMEGNPNVVEVKVDDGCTFGVKLPASWFRTPKPPVRRTMTEEQRRAAAERLQKARAIQNSH